MLTVNHTLKKNPLNVKFLQTLSNSTDFPKNAKKQEDFLNNTYSYFYKVYETPNLNKHAFQEKILNYLNHPQKNSRLEILTSCSKNTYWKNDIIKNPLFFKNKVHVTQKNEKLGNNQLYEILVTRDYSEYFCIDLHFTNDINIDLLNVNFTRQPYPDIINPLTAKSWDIKTTEIKVTNNNHLYSSSFNLQDNQFNNILNRNMPMSEYFIKKNQIYEKYMLNFQYWTTIFDDDLSNIQTFLQKTKQPELSHFYYLKNLEDLLEEKISCSSFSKKQISYNPEKIMIYPDNNNHDEIYEIPDKIKFQFQNSLPNYFTNLESRRPILIEIIKSLPPEIRHNILISQKEFQPYFSSLNDLLL